MTAKVLGLDVALNKTGVASGSGELWTSQGGSGDGRLVRLYEDVQAEVWRTDLAVVEDLPMRAHSAGLLGQAHGVVRMALYEAGVPYVLVVPSTLKKYATGSGNANKEAMLAAVPIEHADRFADLTDDNQVDAYWLREIGVAKLEGRPVPDAVKWEGWG